MKRLLLDVTTITNDMTGVGRYGLELVREILLKKEFSLSLLVNSKLHQGHELYLLIQGAKVDVHRLNVSGIGPKRELIFFFLAVKLSGHYDVFHSVTSNAPLAFYHRGVVTFHDLKYILYPHYMGKLSFLKSLFIKWQFAFACIFYKKITCSSQSTLNDLLKVFPWMADHILKKSEVVHLGMTPLKVEVFSENLPLDLPYFIYVGELRPHKNIINMIKSFEIFANATHFEGRFLIGGKPHNTFDVKSSDGRVLFLDKVHEKDLGRLYANAIALFFVSGYEGFGLPILEAMNLKVPVITSSVSSMPEIVGDAGIIVDPNDLSAMAKSLEIIAFDPSLRRGLVKKGDTQLAKFSWNKCGGKMISIYHQVANSP